MLKDTERLHLSESSKICPCISFCCLSKIIRRIITAVALDGLGKWKIDRYFSFLPPPRESGSVTKWKQAFSKFLAKQKIQSILNKIIHYCLKLLILIKIKQNKVTRKAIIPWIFWPKDLTNVSLIRNGIGPPNLLFLLEGNMFHFISLKIWLT